MNMNINVDKVYVADIYCLNSEEKSIDYYSNARYLKTTLVYNLGFKYVDVDSDEEYKAEWLANKDGDIYVKSGTIISVKEYLGEFQKQYIPAKCLVRRMSNEICQMKMQNK